jgi:hypothetical protein
VYPPELCKAGVDMLVRLAIPHLDESIEPARDSFAMLKKYRLHTTAT